ALLLEKLLSEATQGTVSWLESYTVTARSPKIPDVSTIVFMHLHESSFLFRQSRPSPYTCAGPLCWFQSRSIPVSVRVGAKSDRAHTLCCSAVIDACSCADQRNEESNATQQTEDTTTAKPRAAKTARMRIMTPIVT